MVVGTGNLTERRSLIVHKGNACGREQEVPCRNTCDSNKQNHAGHIVILCFIFYLLLKNCSILSERPTEQVVPTVVGELL